MDHKCKCLFLDCQFYSIDLSVYSYAIFTQQCVLEISRISGHEDLLHSLLLLLHHELKITEYI